MQKEFNESLADLERIHRERNREEEQALVKRVKNECNQALAKQWEVANEQLSLVIE